MIPMDWIDLDIVTATSQSHRNSGGATSPAHSPLTGECLGKDRCRCVDPGAIVEEKYQHPSPDFQKAAAADPKPQPVG